MYLLFWKLKKCVLEKIFQNDFLSSEFPILKTYFSYRTPIPEILFAYRILIPESFRSIKGNYGIEGNYGIA